jgi:hypothetical protein
MDEGSGDTVTDYGRLGHDATRVNSPAWVTGKVGAYALDFTNASNHYLSFSDTSQPPDAMTIALWINLDNVSDVMRFLCWKNGTPIQAFYYNGGDDKFVSITKTDASNHVISESGVLSLTATTWHHIAVTQATPSSNCNFYLNGTLFAGTLTTNLGTPTRSNKTKAISRYGALDLDQGVTGKLDDIRVYDRVLSESEIQDIYSNIDNSSSSSSEGLSSSSSSFGFSSSSSSEQYSSSSSSLGFSSSSSDSTEQVCSNTVLLLHMDGENGSTAFKDESDSQHVVTANGNAQIDTAQSKFGGASGLFDGSGDYLTIPDSSDWAFGSNDFTIDCWFRLTTDTNSQRLVEQYVDANNQMQFSAKGHQGGGVSRVNFQLYESGTQHVFLNGSTTDPALNTWYHAAVVRSGSDWTLYVNGVAEATDTYSGSYPNFAADLRIGDDNGGTKEVYGNIDEFRIVKGLAVWTSNFTPPTAPYDCPNESSSSSFDSSSSSSSSSSSLGYSSSSSLGYSSSSSSSFGYSSSSSDSTEQACLNTKLLLHMDGEDGSTIFKDESDSQHVVTANDNAQIDTAQSKFGGASAFFDGANDSLSIGASTDFDLSTGDWTVDAWVYLDTSQATIHNTLFSIGTSDYNALDIDLLQDGTISLVRSFNGSTWSALDSASSVWATGSWNHIAAVRHGNDFRVFWNGSQVANDSNSGTIQLNVNSLKIGAHYSNNAIYWWDGWIDEFRIIKGLAVWTSNFTPPTAPYDCPNESSSSSSSFGLSSSSSSLVYSSSSSSSSEGYSSSSSDSTEQVCLNTKLLMHMDGEDGSTIFKDESNSQHVVTANDNAQIDTAQSVFGGASAFFDGSGDYLSIPDSSDWDISSGMFSIDFRVRWTTQTSIDGLVHNHNSSPNGGWEVDYNGTAIRFLLNNSTVKVSHAFTPTLGTWYHVAATFDGTTYRLFLDGSLEDSATGGSPTYEAGGISVGCRYDNGSDPFHGHIDELRIVKGVTTWTSNFTPPTSQYNS